MRNERALKNAKRLRMEMTPAEAKLWRHLRAGRFAGFKFRRQTPIDIFVADFTCRAAMLVIEVDGDTHGTRASADARRTAVIEAQGWRVVRFTNAEVIGNIEGILHSIAALMPLSPTLSPKGERED